MQDQDKGQKLKVKQQEIVQKAENHLIGYLTFHVTKYQLRQLIQEKTMVKKQQPIQRQNDLSQSQRPNPFGFVSSSTKFKKKPSLQSVQYPNIHFVTQTDQQNFILQNSCFKQINLQNPNSPKLKLLWKINFPYLKTLDLSECNIFSIQGLTFCDFPALKILQLYNNKISSISVLKKCKFQAIQKISVEDNPLITIQELARINCYNLRVFQIDKQHSIYQMYVRKLSKINFQTVQNLNTLIKTQGITNLDPNKIHRSDFNLRIQPSWYKIKDRIFFRIKRQNLQQQQ